MQGLNKHLQKKIYGCGFKFTLCGDSPFHYDRDFSSDENHVANAYFLSEPEGTEGLELTFTLVTSHKYHKRHSLHQLFLRDNFLLSYVLIYFFWVVAFFYFILCCFYLFYYFLAQRYLFMSPPDVFSFLFINLQVKTSCLTPSEQCVKSR